jgi:hypothetical protein
MFRAFQDLNYHPPTAGHWGMAESVYRTTHPKLLYNFYGFCHFDGSKKVAVEKLEKFKKRFDYSPVAFWALSWDQMNVLLTAIKNVGTDRVAIRDWIATKSKGMPLLSCNKNAVCRIEEGSPYFYSAPSPKDFGIMRIDKDGNQIWLD